MTLQERIKNNSRICGLEVTQGVTIVKVQFEQGWVATGTDKIKCVLDESRPNLWFFYSSLQDGASFDEIIDLVEENVSANLTLEMKRSLFQTKILELEQFFTNNAYEDLLNLEFVITKKNKGKGKSKNTRKPKQQITTQDVPLTESEDDNAIEPIPMTQPEDIIINKIEDECIL